MTNLEKKIAAFKREAGDKSQYTPEQQRLYYIFTKAKGKEIRFAVIDCEGIKLSVSVDPTDEVKKILLKHYRTDDGTVTAKEILNMFDVVRTGSKRFDKGKYIYQKRYVKRGTVYFTVIEFVKEGTKAVLKSFHSNIGYK